MKLLWVQDLDPFVVGGGAQLNDRSLLVEGLRRGHDINLVVPSTPQFLMEGLDGAIISNATQFPLEIYQEMEQASVPYVFFSHDYWPICKWRLHYAQAAKCRECFLRDRWLPILARARLLVWLSPLHREAWLYSYPELRQHKYIEVPSSINPRDFYDLGIPRSGTIAVNSGLGFKGATEFIRWSEEHPEEQITLVGGNPENRVFPPNVSIVGPVSYEQMNTLYNHHEQFVHLPTTAMPFDRTVVEAYLAGCRVIGNRNVGALSWGVFRQGRPAVAQAVSRAPQRFWNAIERVFVA